MMTTNEFIKRANAQGLDLSKIKVHVLTPADMHAMLDGCCIGCGGSAPKDAVYDMDEDDRGNVYGTIIGYEQEMFCDGCIDNVAVDALYKYGVISKEEHDQIAYFDEEDPNDRLRKEWLSMYPDASLDYDEWVYVRDAMRQGNDQQSSAGGQFDCGDDELPF